SVGLILCYTGVNSISDPQGAFTGSAHQANASSTTITTPAAGTGESPDDWTVCLCTTKGGSGGTWTQPTGFTQRFHATGPPPFEASDKTPPETGSHTASYTNAGLNIGWQLELRAAGGVGPGPVQMEWFHQLADRVRRRPPVE